MQDKEKEVDALDNNTQELVKEEKKFEEKISLDSFTPATEVGDKKSVEKEINDARIAFASVHKDVMKKNRIMGIVFLIVMVGALVLAYILPKAINYMFIALFAFFIVVVVLTRLSRKKMDNAVGEYLRAYGSQSDSYVYKNEDIKDVEMAFRAKPDDEVLRSLEFKNDVFAIGSRDVIKGKMGDINFLSSDASYKVGNAKDKKTHRTVFVGKVVQFDSKIKDEGRVLLYMKGCGDAEPDKVDDVNIVEVNSLKKDWVVYSSNENYSKIFTKPVIDALNKFSVDDTMNDILVSFKQDKVLFALSYSDNLMIIPLENDFDVSSVEHYRQDIEKVCEFAKAIAKNKYISE